MLLLAPPAVMQVASSPLLDKLDLSSVRHVVSGAAALSGRIVNQLRRKMPQATMLDGEGIDSK